ncbi:MAG: hypothetical protein M3463_23660 [Verrucomicrobiota bacterium]|nr:hypothetical protein [Verrucomicrobiota bacterium]
MKTSLRLFCIALSASAAVAQEPVPLKEAQNAARKLTDSLGVLRDLPMATEPDLEKPQAIKAGGAGVLILPDRKLTAESLSGASQTSTPIGQLWTHQVSLAKDGKAVARDQLRVVSVTEKEKRADVQLYLLGAAKNDAGALELVVFGKAKEPLLRVPLVQRRGGSQELPLALSVRKNEEGSGFLSVNILGEYTVELGVVREAQ